MKRAIALGLLGIPLFYAVACGSDPAPPGGGGGSTDGGADGALADGPVGSPDGGEASILDTLDPAKGAFAAELGAVRAVAEVAVLGGATVPDRALVGGDPLLMGMALDRVFHFGSNECVNSAFGCPPRGDADAILGAYGSSRAQLRTALVEAITSLDGWRWVAAAHTAIAWANLLDQAGKLDPASKAAIAPKITALASVATPTEEMQLAAKLPPNFLTVKNLYALTPGVRVPTAAEADAAKQVVQAVVALFGPLGVKVGSLAPFSPPTATPLLTSPGFEVHVRASSLGSLGAPDVGAAVDAYLVALDAAVTAAQGGQIKTYDWGGYFTALDGVVKLLDATIGAADLDVPRPGPPGPAGSGLFDTPPTDKGTLETDPRASIPAKVPSLGSCYDSDGKPDLSIDQIYMMGVYLGVWGDRKAIATERRIPPGTVVPSPATTLTKPIEIAPVPVACVKDSATPVDPALRVLGKAAACGVPIRVPTPCVGKFALDHFDLRVSRLDGAAAKPLVRHVYRPAADGTTPRITWFMPRVDDPDLAKNAFNLYRVEIVAVTRGGASMARCGAIFWPEGTAKLDDSVKHPCDGYVTSPPDLLPDPVVPAHTFVVQKLGGEIRTRPSVMFAARAGETLTYANDSGGSVRFGAYFSPGLPDPAGLASSAIGGVSPLVTGDIADKTSGTVSTPALTTADVPHRWSMGLTTASRVSHATYAVGP